MDYTELRNAYLEALQALVAARCPNRGVLKEKVFQICCERGYFSQDQRAQFDRDHTLQITDLFWECIISGVLGIGGDAANPDLPFFHITDFGKGCIERGEITVYDPTGLISDLKQSVGGLDSVIEEYLREALVCFGRNCVKGATVMVGCASERLLLLIVDAFKQYFSDTAKRTQFEQSIQRRPMKKVLDEFQNRIERIQSELKQNTGRDDWDAVVAGIFNLIRRHRNEAGHPTGISIEKETVLSVILLFREYCKNGYQLKDYFDREQSKIL